MTDFNNIAAINATTLKNGKAKMVAIMNDGSEVIVRKASAAKAYANIYDIEVNGNAQGGGLASYITINAKPGVPSRGGDNAAPVKSIKITYL